MNNNRLDYIDGIRGIAILLVFFAHLSAGVYPHDIGLFKNYTFFIGGGLIGVQLFFALSGYLITKNLINEFKNFGNVNLKLFYLRRFWRLYPVLLLTCIVYVVYVVFFMETRLIIAALGDIIKALTYTTNLPIFPKRFPDQEWMSHTWSLSVEEQFYLIWPIILIGLLKLQSKYLTIFSIFTIILITILLRKYIPLFSYEIFRWDALMIGCLLNFIKTPKNHIIITVSLLTIILYSWFFPDPLENFDYLLSSIACGAFISQGEYLHQLNNKILSYFGKISYSLYLWHIIFMRLGLPGYYNLIISLIISDLSYRLFEIPVLNWARLSFKLTRV